ncbi:hexitol phosphatase HxpB [Alkalimonas sp. MEB108]|uniref:Hexitol phosphatase HxpB n=1 Tax=Alkalimonas cellulosilytica TaxID=3058395 RepID=A0ABU7J0F6_9GAMM|nr:hexitol phosphatase HxpB [Alkalimonas sp. MEB108]MEE1999979.1 hexitol phosphatase HxpB [Alkalimonas sp. MEB108]
MVKAVIFDMDGVLIDSEPMWQQAELQVFSQLGVTLTAEQTRQTAGMTTEAVAKFWYQQSPWQGMSLAETEAAVIAQVARSIATKGEAKKGVQPLLQYLRERRLPVGLATNSSQYLMDTTLDTLAIRHYFAAHCCVEMVAKGKPEPDIYLLAASKLGVAPADCLVFEDSYTGISAAKAAGMTVVAIPAAEEWHHEKFGIADAKIRCLTEFDMRLWH